MTFYERKVIARTELLCRQSYYCHFYSTKKTTKMGKKGRKRTWGWILLIDHAKIPCCAECWCWWPDDIKGKIPQHISTSLCSFPKKTNKIILIQWNELPFIGGRLVVSRSDFNGSVPVASSHIINCWLGRQRRFYFKKFHSNRSIICIIQLYTCTLVGRASDH